MTRVTKVKRRFTLEFKAKIILFYQSLQHIENKSEKSINYLASLSSIDRRTIGTWIKNSHKILEAKYKRNKHKIGSKKDLSECPLMESALTGWVNEQRSTGACLSGNLIQNRALIIYESFHPLHSELEEAGL